MQLVILAGGMGSRIGEESQYRPKPMVEIGNYPIIWHIMKYYSSFGIDDFIVCCGYKGNMIKEYFMDYHMKCSNVSFDLSSGKVKYMDNTVEPWNITLANTGLKTLTAGRIAQIERYIEGDEFMLTYGDGVSNVDINALLDFHHKVGKTTTITVTKPEGRFGVVSLDEATGGVKGFKEKARRDQSYVNAGFMVCNRKLFDYLGDGSEMLEAGPFEKMAADNEMAAYEHPGFWSPMDNVKDKKYLEELWDSGQAPWKVE